MSDLYFLTYVIHLNLNSFAGITSDHQFDDQLDHQFDYQFDHQFDYQLNHEVDHHKLESPDNQFWHFTF